MAGSCACQFWPVLFFSCYLRGSIRIRHHLKSHSRTSGKTTITHHSISLSLPPVLVHGTSKFGPTTSLSYILHKGSTLFPTCFLSFSPFFCSSSLDAINPRQFKRQGFVHYFSNQQRDQKEEAKRQTALWVYFIFVEEKLPFPPPIGTVTK